MVPSHYLHVFWLIFNWTHRNKLHWNLNQNTKLSSLNPFSVTGEMCAIAVEFFLSSQFGFGIVWWIFNILSNCKVIVFPKTSSTRRVNNTAENCFWNMLFMVPRSHINTCSKKLTYFGMGAECEKIVRCGAVNYNWQAEMSHSFQISFWIKVISYYLNRKLLWCKNGETVPICTLPV